MIFVWVCTSLEEECDVVFKKILGNCCQDCESLSCESLSTHRQPLLQTVWLPLELKKIDSLIDRKLIWYWISSVNKKWQLKLIFWGFGCTKWDIWSCQLGPCDVHFGRWSVLCTLMRLTDDWGVVWPTLEADWCTKERWRNGGSIKCKKVLHVGSVHLLFWV